MRGQVIRMSHSDSYPLLWMTEGRSVSAKSDSMTWHSKWMFHLENFPENALKASSSRNRIWDSVGSEDEEAREWRGFWAGVNLRLGAIDTTNVNRKREKKTIRKVLNNIKYNKYIEKRVRMHGKCMNMWHVKKIASWTQPNPNLSAHKQIAHI